MSVLTDLLSTVFERRHRASSSLRHDVTKAQKLAAELVGSAGEISGLKLAQDLLCCYGQFSDDEKLSFFRYIATEMDINPIAVRQALDLYEEQPSRGAYRQFLMASEPPRQEFFRRLNRFPGATGSLLGLRADLMRLGRDEPALAALDLDLCHLFRSWFNRGFLVLRPISWESPAHILEKIITYEAVHAIDSWDDLRRRLEPCDRRCFAFFHPAVPDEPLIFVEVALTRGIPGSIQDLLSENREEMPHEEADTAVFYSISNCQAGLSGISFGNLLIKQVAADLSAELKGLKTFVTLSPVPGLTKWLNDEDFDWDVDSREQMRRLTAFYLLNAKRKGGLPLDPVARFHLGNGAILHAIHAAADTSSRGMAQSGGTMVNYLYDLDKADQNHEQFAQSREVLASTSVRSLAKAMVSSQLKE